MAVLSFVECYRSSWCINTTQRDLMLSSSADMSRVTFAGQGFSRLHKIRCTRCVAQCLKVEIQFTLRVISWSRATTSNHNTCFRTV
jgi:hypothetical protein